MAARHYTAVALLVTVVGCSIAACSPPSGPGFDGIRPDEEEAFGSGASSGRGGSGFVGAGGVNSGTGGGPPIECKRGKEACASFSECCTNQCNADGCTACAEVDQPCDRATPCCEGTCFNSVCRSNCLDAFGACTTGAECCSGACDNGRCPNCEQLGGGCIVDDPNLDCCPGLSCADTLQLPSLGSCCRAAGTPCANDADCCGIPPVGEPGRVCRNSVCCAITGGACAADGECCSGRCAGGRCTDPP